MQKKKSKAYDDGYAHIIYTGKKRKREQEYDETCATRKKKNYLEEIVFHFMNLLHYIHWAHSVPFHLSAYANLST